ncbi:DNA/RNA polymerase [Cadophora sp. DSE1049]|nr:DNA/RNA polymerase [Cadophora sp. DSE1049]
MSDLSQRSLSSGGPRSQFTHRDLRCLGNYSPHSPLRVIALVDYDAFYAQCEAVRLNLDATQPLVVQQWNAIIALNYAARGFGFSRGASVEDVKRLCPNIVLQHVATWREGESSWAYRPDAADPAMMKRDKAALDPYRIQSRKSLKIITNHLPPAPLQRIEKASVDEVFLDLSKQVHAILLERYPQLAIENDLASLLPLPQQDIVLDWEAVHLVDFPADNLDPHHFDWDDIALNIGAQIIRELRREIFNSLHYTCSAGIAHNKALAKLGAGYKKSNQQTVIRGRAVGSFLSTYKMTSIRGLAGIFGARAEKAFGSSSITDLLAISQEHMVATLGRGDGLHFLDENLEAAADEATPAWPCLSIGLALHGLSEAHQARIRTRRVYQKKHITASCSHDMPDNFATDGYLCPTCAKIIAPANVLEHLDWHVALDLQAQL